MGRDWTPREHLAVEKFNIENGLGSIWDFLEKTVMHFGAGDTERICPDEELALRKQFPVLGKLMSNTGEYSFLSVCEKLSCLEGGIDLLHAKDLELATYIETGVGDENSALIKWFNGELDPSFYYGDYNDKLFGESIVLEAWQLVGKDKVCSVDELISDAAERSDASGVGEVGKPIPDIEIS